MSPALLAAFSEQGGEAGAVREAAENALSGDPETAMS